MRHGRIPKAARELLVIMLRDEPNEFPEMPGMRELCKRGLATQTGLATEITPHGARKISSYRLTDRGRHSAQQLRAMQLN